MDGKNQCLTSFRFASRRSASLCTASRAFKVHFMEQNLFPRFLFSCRAEWRKIGRFPRFCYLMRCDIKKGVRQQNQLIIYCLLSVLKEPPKAMPVSLWFGVNPCCVRCSKRRKIKFNEREISIVPKASGKVLSWRQDGQEKRSSFIVDIIKDKNEEEIYDRAWTIWQCAPDKTSLRCARQLSRSSPTRTPPLFLLLLSHKMRV